MQYFYARQDKKYFFFFFSIGQKNTLGPLFRLKNSKNRACIEKKYFFTLRAQCHFAHARIKQRALNQALHTSYEMIVFDTRVRK